MKRLLKRALASGLSRTMLAAVAGAGLAAASLPAQAVEYPVNFGEPVVLSERGQPLKVLLPFEGTPNDRASAVAFLVENAEVPDGFRAPVARNFVIMRPDASPYVIFHSEEDVTAPQILLTVNVMGDPNSPLSDAPEHSRERGRPDDDGHGRRQRTPGRPPGRPWNQLVPQGARSDGAHRSAAEVISLPGQPDAAA